MMTAQDARRWMSRKAGPAARAMPYLRLSVHAMALAKASIYSVPGECHVEELCREAFEGSCYSICHRRSQ
jgi:hypothetical protein